MSSTRKLNLNIDEIDLILNGYYAQKISSSQIARNMKISIQKVKNVIKDYSAIYLNKYPQYKPIDEVSVDVYEQHILSSSYEPRTIDINKLAKKKKVSPLISSSIYCE